jgi:hypothetical protein
MHHGGEAFNNVEKTYGTTLTFKEKPKPKKTLPQVDHPLPFKPSNPVKKGRDGHETISLFPNWIPEKEFQQKTKQPKKDQDRASFKLTHNGLTRPTPSVVTLSKNIRSEFSHMLGKRF